MGGAADFKVEGTKQDSRVERAKKKLYPIFPNVRVQASKYQQGPIEYIEICCLVVALINIGRPRPMVL